MKFSRLVYRSLLQHWRTNLPVIAGIAVAVAVLSGALMVGRSVRGSLEDLLFERIGKTETVIAANRFFGENIAQAFTADGKACPIIYLQGLIIHEKREGDKQERMRVPRVHVYGIDSRFWNFQSMPLNSFPDDRTAFVGASLAKQLGIEKGDSILLQVESQQTIPREWLYGRRDTMVKTIRLSCESILPPEKLGEFALRPSQGDVYSIFVPMQRLQKELEVPGSINTILLSDLQNSDLTHLSDTIAANLSLNDLELKLIDLPSQKGFYLESNRILIEETVVEQSLAVAAQLGLSFSPVYTYMANAIRAGSRSIPYSAISAADIGNGALTEIRSSQPLSPNRSDSDMPPIVLTNWAKKDLNVDVGETIDLEYYIWQEAGNLVTRSASFKLAGTVAEEGRVDTSLAPEIPGVTESASMSDWDPPFPLDLKRIRKKDEEYWDRYHATPKAFIPLSIGQKLWRNRFGELTSVRFAVENGAYLETSKAQFSEALLNRISPENSGFSIHSIKETGLEASRGSTDFGEYFIYFSFFLIAAGILLSALFFRLMVEQRVKEIGILKVSGFSPGRLQSLFLFEGTVLSIAGSVLGLFFSLLYGRLMVYGLSTWWVDAVGTSRLSLHFSWLDLASGAITGVGVALATIFWTLYGFKRISPRALLTGNIDPPSVHRRRTRIMGVVALIAAVFAITLLGAGMFEMVSQTISFFAAGFLLLVSILCVIAFSLRRSRPRTLTGNGWKALLKLGMRNAGYRPGRSLLCASLIASATFIIVSTEAFHRDPDEISLHRDSGTGGYPFVAESTLPVVYDLNSADGQEALGIQLPPSMDADSIQFVPFRERPGDDTSCLNLYTPQEPRIFGAPGQFLHSGRFAFSRSLASTPEQKQNPWLLLDTVYPDGAIAAVADANTIQYVLHLSVGSDVTIQADNGTAVRLRLTAALEDSIFQGGLLISEENFLKLFPDQEGYRFFLIDMPPVEDETAMQPLKESLGYWGIQLHSSQYLLSSYHRVENTYLSTFQSLGTLGLVLGTLGLATVLLRNVLERRSELALLRVAGYRERTLAVIVLSENILLLFWGVGTGIICALLAIAPALHSRGESLPLSILGSVLVPVLFAGIVASLIAVIAVFRSPLLPALRSE